MKKLMLNGVEVVVGSWLTSSGTFEGGNVVGIDVVKEEVYVYDGREGFVCSEVNDNMGDLRFV